MKKMVRTAAITTWIAALLFGSGHGAASANPIDPEVAEVPFVLSGYDEAVASENGFDIGIDGDGNPYPIPLTDDAKTLLKGTPYEPGAMSPMGTSTNNCGTAHLYIGTPNTAAIQIDTGFASRLGGVVYRNWVVAGAVTSGGFSESFSGFHGGVPRGRCLAT